MLTSSILVTQVRESPNVAQAHNITCRGQDILPFPRPLFSLFNFAPHLGVHLLSLSAKNYQYTDSTHRHKTRFRRGTMEKVSDHVGKTRQITHLICVWQIRVSEKNMFDKNYWTCMTPSHEHSSSTNFWKKNKKQKTKS